VDGGTAATTSAGAARKGISQANKSKGKRRREAEEETDEIDVNMSTFGKDSDSDSVGEAIPESFKKLKSKVVDARRHSPRPDTPGRDGEEHFPECFRRQRLRLRSPRLRHELGRGQTHSRSPRRERRRRSRSRSHSRSRSRSPWRERRVRCSKSPERKVCDDPTVIAVGELLHQMAPPRLPRDGIGGRFGFTVRGDLIYPRKSRTGSRRDDWLRESAEGEVMCWSRRPRPRLQF
jgi:hypothetical protein